jgi:hypothetical protein
MGSTKGKARDKLDSWTGSLFGGCFGIISRRWGGSRGDSAGQVTFAGSKFSEAPLDHRQPAVVSARRGKGRLAQHHLSLKISRSFLV